MGYIVSAFQASARHGLKGQKIQAQGTALGVRFFLGACPERAKHDCDLWRVGTPPRRRNLLACAEDRYAILNTKHQPGHRPIPHAPLEFRPHPLFPTGHVQTLAGLYLPQGRIDEQARQQNVALDDGDQVVLNDDCPADWQAGNRIALLIHGLTGDHSSPYMQRIARKLNNCGVRTFRMDLRGCGAGAGLARMPYHSGRSEDAAAALGKIAELCPGSPATLIGFSLGGNITLKLLGESAGCLPSQLDRAVAVCPPVDLLTCVQSLARGLNRFYDRHFVVHLQQQLDAKRRLIPDAPQLDARHKPRGVFDFDEMYTAPVCGFGTALNYYRLCSSAQFVPEIRVPTLILAAADDPLVPRQMFDDLRLSSDVTLHLSPSGGHLGFIGRQNGDPDRRWMDWRVVEWATK